MQPNPAKFFFWLKLAAFVVVAVYAARIAYVRYPTPPEAGATATNKTVTVTLPRTTQTKAAPGVKP